ncbi:MAG: GldG family protein [Candidatus Parcubacteria bacterium]|nr:GldG family protein [Candidatus Parcubacteria bacterium]
MKNILNRKNLFTTQSLALLLTIIGIVLVVNLISINHFGRLDLTTDKQYTISAPTKNTLKSLDDLLTIKVYFTQKLPANLEQTAQYVRDILGEYKAYSPKIKIEFIDPAKNEANKAEVQSIGIPEIEMQVMEKDEFKVQKGYLGIALFYGDKKEILPFIQEPQNLEYDLTTAVKRLTSTELKKVGFLTGHDEHGLFDMNFLGAETNQINDYTTIKKSLDKNYTVTTVDITSGQKIENIDTLIVAGPKKALTERELYEIDQFVMRGGKAIFLLDEVTVGQGLQATPNQTGLEKILANYGIQVNTNLVGDTSNETVGFTSGYMQFFLPYPFWPKLIKDNFDKSSQIMNRLQTISLPWSSSLTPMEKSGLKITSLATTTYAGSTISTPFNLDPNQQYNPTDRKKVPMIILAEGKFTSAYAGKEAPKLESEKTATDQKTIDLADNDNQIIAVANSNFIDDQNLQRFPDNAVFFLNAVDYLTMGPELISIRAKALTDRPIKTLDDEAKMIVKAINIILIPLLVIIIGIVRFYRRKKK